LALSKRSADPHGSLAGPRSMSGVANEYRNANHRLQAKAAYERAIALDMRQVEARVALGEMALKEGEASRALGLERAALRMEPDNVRVRRLAF